MTLPTTSLNATDDDSDMFGPPRTSPLRYTRPRVPMISAKLRLREERKRILQLCAHKLERIKDSETNLRRSVCINNTYSRLTDEVRREKQSRYLANLPKSEITNNQTDDFFSSFSTHDESLLDTHSNDILSNQSFSHNHDMLHPMAHNNQHSNSMSDPLSSYSTHTTTTTSCSRSSRCVDTDLETLDRELNALDAAMPLVDPEITQGAEQLEKAISRKRSRSEEDNDRLVREALSTFSHYLPSPRLLSGIDDCPLLMPSDSKRYKTDSSSSSSSLSLSSEHLLDFDFDHNHNQSQKEFEVIMDALRLGGTSQSSNSSSCNDSCGQAAMLSENGGVFHNLVASLET
ncbi:uncharacterized protein LOC129577856 [Sitodiplosis mosellana]|uniref:uncharacterized protein LOC129577856 n=1 Tax=Sitodiplosis mosellana TaxID=263140 RepID=UPI00244410D3|nr:uncharacterized protein LOC129577856 [Sitodiplosis mosellana]